MRLRCAVDGDVLDDRSDTNRCNSHATGRLLSVARHYGHAGRVPQLPQSWLRSSKLSFIDMEL